LKLALGTVQFGLNYGVSNAVGVVSQVEASDILADARSHGIDTLDTAAAYGESESVLGASNIEGWQVVSKLPPEIQGDLSVADWAVASVNGSLARLRQSKLYGILLHRPSQLLGVGGDGLYRALQQLKLEGVVSKIGVSIYDPEELNTLCQYFDFDLVQAPFSVFDRRLVRSGWMTRLAASGVELHVRSIFLQGLLLMKGEERPLKFNRWAKLWCDWHAWLAESDISATEACIRYALSQQEIGKVVVGVQSRGQLAEIVNAASRGALEIPLHLSTDAEALLNPACWSTLA
jgi:aryl-alcohol dehydrogenase-like predicted oxidoreductase